MNWYDVSGAALIVLTIGIMVWGAFAVQKDQCDPALSRPHPDKLDD